jgi:UDP-3-O-[3-hydroxymyristoyl] glucosamine N-acyltransferase
MVETRSYTAGELAECCHGRLADPGRSAGIAIQRVATLDEADSNAISWISEPRRVKSLAKSRAAVIIGNEALLAGDPRGLIVGDPELAVAEVLDRFDIPPARPSCGVHPAAIVHASASVASTAAVGAYAVIHADARIDEDTIIHEGVSVGRGVQIGRNCEIYDRCVLYDRVRIGSRVILHAGAVIGADGFGYIFREKNHRKLAHVGTVIIEDDVEIGANTCVDRAKVGATVIGRGSKIDNLVMIAHNCRIGPLCVIAGQSGLSGSVRLGTGVALGGQAGITHGVKLGDGVRVAAKCAVISDFPAGQVVFGSPAYERTAALRDVTRVRKLAELFAEVTELRKRVGELEATADHRERG